MLDHGKVETVLDKVRPMLTRDGGDVELVGINDGTVQVKLTGAIRYPLWKFLLIGWLGKSLKFVVLVFAMVWGWETLLRYLG